MADRFYMYGWGKIVDITAFTDSDKPENKISNTEVVAKAPFYAIVSIEMIHLLDEFKNIFPIFLYFL